MVAEQERMVAMVGTLRGAADHDDVSWPDLQDLKASCQLMDWFIADRNLRYDLKYRGTAERVSGSVVSANYFKAWG